MVEYQPAAPRLSGTQRLWLRELGLDRTLLAPITTSRVSSQPAMASEQSIERAAPGVSRSGNEATTPTVDADAVVSASAQHIALSPENGAGNTAPDAVASGQQANDGSIPDAEPTPTAPVTRLSRLPATTPQGKPAAAPQVRAAPSDSLIAQADAETLRTQVEACTACALCDGRRHAVYGAGAPTAKWMVVGEAPGEQEDSEGLPFVGRSGQLLDAMLQAVGMNRSDDVFIANVIKCRPPGNRNPKPEEIAACSPYLMRQIALVQPAGLLVLGRFAAQVLLGTDASIAQLRGKVHTFKGEDEREIPVVVSYHPAYLLRTPAEKARAWQDLQLAAASLVAPV